MYVYIMKRSRNVKTDDKESEHFLNERLINNLKTMKSTTTNTNNIKNNDIDIISTVAVIDEKN